MAATGIAMFLLSMLFSLISAVPLTPLESQLQAANGNKTLLSSEFAPSWATTSNVRSTASLLWTCVLTLSVCVYTIIHINIPLPSETQFSHFRRKTKWVILAILAPELALATALQQWSTARALKRELNSLSSKQNDGKVDTMSTERFSMTYCFYAAMGGFVVDVSDIHDEHSLLTLQPLGIVELAGKGYFLEISEKAIKDKSKADVLAKLLVCVQIVWMVIQCIGRKAEGLPISLLEIHVLVHVACALCMYALWIEKPLDILDPTIADASRFPNELALMLLGSSCSRDPLDMLKLYNPHPGSLHDVPHMAPYDEGVQTAVPDRSSLLDQNGPSAVPIITYETSEDTAGRLLYCQWESSGSKRYFTLKQGQSLPSGLGINHDDNTFEKTLSEKDLKRWARATVSMRQESEKYLLNKDRLKIPQKCLRVRSKNFVDTAFNIKSLRGGLIDEMISDPLFWAMLVTLPVVYGSVHLAAWNFEFPSDVEKIMWRVACAVVAGGILGVLLIFGIYLVSVVVLDPIVMDDILELVQPLGKWVQSLGKWVQSLGKWVLSLGEWMDHLITLWLGVYYERVLYLVGWIIGSSIIFLVLLFLALYFGARLFIIVESFISVRRLPLGTFLTVDWANYIPHL